MTIGSLFLPLADGPPDSSRPGLDRRDMLRAVYNGVLAPGDVVLSLRQIYWIDRANAGDQLVYCRVRVGEFQDRTEMIPYRERGAFYGPFDRDAMARPEGDFDLFEVIERGKALDLAPDMVTAGGFLRACDYGTIDQWLAEAGDAFDPNGKYNGTSLLDLVASNPCGLSYRYSRPAVEKLIELGAPLTTNMGPGWGMSLLQWLTRDARDVDLLAAALRQKPDVAACSTLLHEFVRVRRYEWHSDNHDFLMRLLEYLPVDALDDREMTPLQVLLSGDRELQPGMMESFELLVGAGAAVDKVDSAGNTLLHCLLKNQLLRRNHQPMIDRLIELGCPVAARNLKGHAVWHLKPPPACGNPEEERFHLWLKERLAPFQADAPDPTVARRDDGNLDALDREPAASESTPHPPRPAERQPAVGGQACDTAKTFRWWGPAIQVSGAFDADDYPAPSLRREEEGVVAVAYVIGADGTVASCEVQDSSGHQALDERTCEVVRTRFQFKPARNWLGRAVREERVQKVRWRLPD